MCDHNATCSGRLILVTRGATRCLVQQTLCEACGNITQVHDEEPYEPKFIRTSHG